MGTDAEGFRVELRRLLAERGWNTAELARRTGYNRGYLWEIVSGKTGKRPSPELRQDLDDALEAGGGLIAAGEDVDRRDFLKTGSLAVTLGPLSQLEMVRDGMDTALGASATDQWGEVVEDYTRAHFTTSPGALLGELIADAALLQRQLQACDTDSGRRELARHAGMLSTMVAMAWAGQGENQQARRWWATARRAAAASADARTTAWVASWEVSDGTYEDRPVPTLVRIGREAAQVVGSNVDAGTAGTYAGLAQAYAVAGDRTAALEALERVEWLTERMPASVAADYSSMLGWPEVRLHHTASYVYTALGDTRAAYRAQDLAFDHYGHHLPRECAAVQLHRAKCMVLDGDVSGGIQHAHDVLERLPAEQFSQIVYAMGRAALTAVPAADRRSPSATALRDRLVHPPSPSPS